MAEIPAALAVACRARGIDPAEFLCLDGRGEASERWPDDWDALHPLTPFAGPTRADAPTDDEGGSRG